MTLLAAEGLADILWIADTTAMVQLHLFPLNNYWLQPIPALR